MAKIDLELVADVLSRSPIEPGVQRRILDELNRAAQKEAEEAAENREPPVKKQFVVVASDPEQQLPSETIIGWVAQIAETESPATTLERIHRCAAEFNASPRGRKQPLKSVGETFEVVGAKIQKNHGIVLKTKVPIVILPCTNALPSGNRALRLEDLRG